MTKRIIKVILFYLIIVAYQIVKKFLKLAEIKSSNIPPLNYQNYPILFMAIKKHYQKSGVIK